MKNFTTDQLLEAAAKDPSAVLLPGGVLCTFTGQHTGRSPNAKAIGKDSLTKDTVDWDTNSSVIAPVFNSMLQKFQFYKNNRQVYSQDVWAVRESRCSLPIRVYTKHAKHSLFVRNMFIPP